MLLQCLQFWKDPILKYLKLEAYPQKHSVDKVNQRTHHVVKYHCDETVNVKKLTLKNSIRNSRTCLKLYGQYFVIQSLLD